MKFLIDQDIYALTANFLIKLGYDIVLASDIGLSRADDEQLLLEAQAHGRILVTRDRDFGNLVFVKGLGSGVIYLRMLPSTCEEVHAQLERVLKEYKIEALRGAFIVVERSGHRIRRIPES